MSNNPNNNNDESVPRFTIKLAGSNNTNEAIIKNVFAFLMNHPLVVLDPGIRWAVSGVLVKFLSFKVEAKGDSFHVSARFEWKKMRISGRNGTHTKGVMIFGLIR